MKRSYWQGMQLSTFGLTANASISTTFAYGPKQPRSQDIVTKTEPTVTALAGFLGWGSDAWGATGWGSQNASTTVDSELFFFVPGGIKCNTVTATITGSGPGKIRGLDFRARELPLTKSTVASA
jgi:hypothetical protein